MSLSILRKPCAKHLLLTSLDMIDVPRQSPVALPRLLPVNARARSSEKLFSSDIHLLSADLCQNAANSSLSGSVANVLGVLFSSPGSTNFPGAFGATSRRHYKKDVVLSRKRKFMTSNDTNSFASSSSRHFTFYSLCSDFYG